MAGTSTGPGTGIDSLIDPSKQQLILSAYGFSVCPLERDENDRLVCPAIVFPTCALQRHLPRLALPAACVRDIAKGDLRIEKIDDVVFVDLDGLRLSYGDGSGSRLIVRRETEEGHFETEPPEDILDFNLVPAAETFTRGLRLGRNWRESHVLQAHVALPGGSLGALPDAMTGKAELRWGFDRWEQAKRRFVSSLAVHVSDHLQTRTLTLTPLRGGEPATIETASFPGTSLAFASVLNGAVNSAGEYELGEPHQLDFAHMDAMLHLCAVADRQSVKFDMGRRIERPQPVGAAGVNRGFAPASVNPFALIDGLILSPGNSNCGTRSIIVA